MDLLTDFESFFTLQQWKLFGVSTAFWTGLYIFSLAFKVPLKDKFRKLNRKDELDVRNRVISIIHGLIIMILTGYILLYDTPTCGRPNTSFETNIIFISMGYFAYDFLAMVYYGLLDWAMTLHHAICVIGYAVNISQGLSANLTLGTVFFGEVSNAPMHISVVLKHLGLRHTKMYELTEILFMLLYVVCRVIGGVLRIWGLLSCPSYHFIMKFGAVGLLVQTLHFSTKMVQILRKRYLDIMNRYEKKVSMTWWTPLTSAQLEKLCINSEDDKRAL